MNVAAKLPALRTRQAPLVLDGLVALVLTVVTQVQIGASRPAAHAAMLLTLALAFRRRAPLAVAVLAGAAVAAQGLAVQPPSVFGEYVAITLAAYTVAAEATLGRALAGLTAIVAGVVLHDIPTPEYGTAGGMASDLVTPVAFWGIGRAVRIAYVRARAARAEAEAAAARASELTRAAIAEERRRLARELHDIVTHSLGVIVLQAQGGRRVLGSREQVVNDALVTIERSGRSALEEMRRLLGLLRENGERSGIAPPPRLRDLDGLVAGVAEAGLPVDLRVDGDPVELEPGLELSAYRVVQEALTNALKHAPGAYTHVAVRYRPRSLELEISDDGDGGDGTPLAGDGRGLLGMRERVGFYGGVLEHGRQPDGGFRVHATFPLAAS